MPRMSRILREEFIALHESTDLAADKAHAATLARLRGALAAQYVAEGRGEGWVKAGKLVPRPKSTLYSPNYPGGPPKYE